MAQVPPYQLLGQISNLSAEALAAARDGLDRKISELQGILTDSWRNVFRLSSKAAGDTAGWSDINSTVIWRDTSAKSFAATVDALGKAAQMLGIPVTELWRRIPGATADDVNAWIKVATEQGALKELNDLINASLTGDMMTQNPSAQSPYQEGSVGVRHVSGYSQPAIKTAAAGKGTAPSPPPSPAAAPAKRPRAVPRQVKPKSGGKLLWSSIRVRKSQGPQFISLERTVPQRSTVLEQSSLPVDRLTSA
jgi:hypothetical protein